MSKKIMRAYSSKDGKLTAPFAKPEYDYQAQIPNKYTVGGRDLKIVEGKKAGKFSMFANKRVGKKDLAATSR